MTRRDEVIRMARAAGFVLSDNATDEAVGRFERFADLAAAAKQEQCAKDAEAIRDDYAATGSNLQACAADYIAEKIRALKDGEE